MFEGDNVDIADQASVGAALEEELPGDNEKALHEHEKRPGRREQIIAKQWHIEGTRSYRPPNSGEREVAASRTSAMEAARARRPQVLASQGQLSQQEQVTSERACGRACSEDRANRKSFGSRV